MKIRVDKARCTGHGLCAAMAPTVYALDDLGFCAVDSMDVSAADRESAQKGMLACPEQALELEDE